MRRWNLYTALAIDIRAAARAAGFRLRTAHQRTQFTSKLLVPVWNNVFEETHLQYNAMFIGVFDLLRAKKDQLRAQQRHVEALAEYWDAQTDLKQLLMGSARGASENEQRTAGEFGGGMQATFSMIEQSSDAAGTSARADGGN